jgi:hypothetical protein
MILIFASIVKYKTFYTRRLYRNIKNLLLKFIVIVNIGNSAYKMIIGKW